MAYRLEPTESIEEGLRRVAREQIDRALAEIESDLDPHETVHQVRKRIKKLRGLARLCRPALPNYAAINETLRDTARRLSEVRDAAAHLEALAVLRAVTPDAPDDWSKVEQALARHRDERIADDALVAERLAEAAATLQDLRDQVDAWTLQAEGFGALRGGLAKTYQRARRAMRTAFEVQTTEAFHEWRKHLKYHWHHLSLLSPTWPEVTKPWATAVKDLTDKLGDAHDMAVLADVLEPTDAPRISVLEHAEAHRATLERQADPLGQRLLVESPDALQDRLAAWYATAVSVRTPRARRPDDP